MDKQFLAETLTQHAEDAEDIWATTDEENPGYPNGAGVQEKELISELVDGDSDEDTAISDAITTIFTRFDKALNATFPDGIADEVYCDLCDWLKENLVAFDESRWQFKCGEIIWEIQYEIKNVSTPEELLKNLERYAVWASRDEGCINDWGSSFGWIYENSSEAYDGLVSSLAVGEFLESEFDIDGVLEEGLGYNACCGYYYEKSPDALDELMPNYDRSSHRYDTFEDAKKHEIENLIENYPDYCDEDYKDLDIDGIAQRLILKDENGQFYVEHPGSKKYWEAVQR